VETHLSQRDEHVAALMRGEVGEDESSATNPGAVADDLVLEVETQGSQDVLRKYLSVIVEESPPKGSEGCDFMLTGATRGMGVL
jgi:hypothetical protein